MIPAHCFDVNYAVNILCNIRQNETLDYKERKMNTIGKVLFRDTRPDKKGTYKRIMKCLMYVMVRKCSCSMINFFELPKYLEDWA